MDMSDYKGLNKGFRYIFVIIDNFSEHTRYVLLKKNAHTKGEELSNIRTTSKRKRNKIESDRGKEFQTTNFQNWVKQNKIHHYSGYPDKKFL